MLQYIEQQRGKWHYGQELCEAAEARAERLIKEALEIERISEEQLAKWPKGHPFKLKLAADRPRGVRPGGLADCSRRSEHSEDLR